MEPKVIPDAQAFRNRIEEPWGALNWLANAKLGNATGLTLGRVMIKAGCCNPRHAHFDCEEVLYLLSGELRHSFGDKEVLLKAGDTLWVPAGVFHHGVNIGTTEADMIVAYSSAHRDFVKEK